MFDPERYQIDTQKSMLAHLAWKYLSSYHTFHHSFYPATSINIGRMCKLLVPIIEKLSLNSRLSTSLIDRLFIDSGMVPGFQCGLLY